MNKNYDTLAFYEIIKRLEEHANSPKAKQKIRELEPYLKESELRKNLRETTQARQMLDTIGMPPTPAWKI